MLDEADQMLDLGFIHALRAHREDIFRQNADALLLGHHAKSMIGGTRRQPTCANPVKVQVGPAGQAGGARSSRRVHFVAERRQGPRFWIELPRTSIRDELALVFGRTKHGSEKLTKQL